MWGQSTFYIDGVGNRTHDINTIGGVTTVGIQGYALTSNRILGKTVNGATARTFTYDNGGNILTDTRPGEVFAFTYNKRNRPSSITRNSVAYATYGYNALEQLVSRSTSAPGGPVGTVHYIYDRHGHLIAEADSATGTTARDYIWAAANDNNPVDLPLAIAESSVITHVHTDHLGRPTRMTDAAKATVWQASFKPWGEVQSLSGTKAINLRFPGQYFQIETNLAYNHHRHYDPSTGRYTQPDPLGFVDGPSVYAYAGNSPYMYVDRDGLSAIGTLTGFILPDLVVPDPTDAVPWKWLGYGAAYCVAIGTDVLAMSIILSTPAGEDEKGEKRKNTRPTRDQAIMIIIQNHDLADPRLKIA